MNKDWEKAFINEFGMHFEDKTELQFALSFIEDLLKELTKYNE